MVKITIEKDNEVTVKQGYLEDMTQEFVLDNKDQVLSKLDDLIEGM